MKILVHNYSSETSTEPLYFYRCIQEKIGECRVWNNQESAFDIFDDFDPSVFITHFSMITNDIVKRLQKSKTKLVVNVTGAVQEVLDRIESFGLEGGVFFFQNFNLLDNVEVIEPCADTYVAQGVKLKKAYDIETLFVVDNPRDIELLSPLMEDRKTFHVISLVNDLIGLKEVDACVPVAHLSRLYQNYSEIIVTKPTQSLFDAAYYGGGAKILNNLGNLDFLQKKVVESAHSPYNRVSALLEKIGNSKG